MAKIVWSRAVLNVVKALMVRQKCCIGFDGETKMDSNAAFITLWIRNRILKRERERKAHEKVIRREKEK